jgi:hypothetical protein
VRKRAISIIIFLSAFLAGYFLVPNALVIETRKIDVLKIDRVELEVASGESLEAIEDVNDDRGEDSFRIRLLEVGEGFHGAEVDAKNGENWLGLFANGKGAEVRSTTIRINRVHDPIVDDNPTARTGKNVGISSPLNPIFLIKNAKAIREGSVETVFRGTTLDEARASEPDLSLDEKLSRLDKNFLQTYDVGGKQYVLRVIKAKNSKGEKLLALALEFQGTRQILHTMQTSYEGEIGVKEWLGQVGTLYWVGDLDGDRKPDFYIDLFWHDNVSDRVLFLSSEAKKSQLVKKAARFTTTGC